MKEMINTKGKACEPQRKAVPVTQGVSTLLSVEMILLGRPSVLVPKTLFLDPPKWWDYRSFSTRPGLWFCEHRVLRKSEEELWLCAGGSTGCVLGVPKISRTLTYDGSLF